MIQQPDGLYCPDTGQTCYDWTMIEIGIPNYLMDAYNKPINSVIHAGGNIGIYALEFAKKAKNVYVFEPANENFTALSLNCARVDNIFLYKAALGNNNVPIQVFNPAPDLQCGAWQVRDTGNIPTLQIDNLGLEDVSIIHLDIEGYELFALKGAENTIKRCKPLLAFEILNHNDNYDYTITDLYDYVTNLGYTRHIKYANEIMFME
jgi:FkbM family methyltransferase